MSSSVQGGLFCSAIAVGLASSRAKTRLAVTFLGNKTISWIDNAYTGAKEREKDGIGGAVLWIDQDNTSEAYIGAGAKVKAAGDVTVDAKNEAYNLAIAAAGGSAQKLAFNGSGTVNLIDNTTKAYIAGDVETAAGSVDVSAEDGSTNVNIAGAVGVSQETAIGVSVSYNHIDRTTDAYITGNITAEKGNVAVDAKNTGDIVSVAAAGSVAYSVKPDGGELADEDAGMDAWDCFDDEGYNIHEEIAHALSDGDKNTFNRVLNKLNNEGKTSDFAGAGTVTMNRILDNANAYVAPSKTETKDADGKVIKTEYGARPQIHTGALSITSNNDSYIFNGSGALSLSISASKWTSSNTAIAGTFAYNSITANNNAYVDSADLVLTGNTGTKKVKGQDGNEKEEAIDESLTISSKNDEQIVNIAASVGVALRNGRSVAVQASMNWVDNTNKAYVKDAEIKADEAVKISAVNNERIDTYTGAVSWASSGGHSSTGGASVGSAIAINIVQGETDAYVKDSSMEGTAANAKGGSVDVSAADTGIIRSIAAAASISTGSTGWSASVTGVANVTTLTTNAYIDTAKAMNVGKVTIDGLSHATATLGAGAISATFGGAAAVGAAITVMTEDSTVNAYMKGDASKKNTVKADGLEITAENSYNGSASDSESDSEAKNVAIGAGGATEGWAGAGSVTVNTITQKTDAYLGAGKYDVDQKAVDIEAQTTARLFGMAGGLALASGVGVGAGIDTQIYSGTTHAYIADGAKLTNAGNVTVHAESLEKMQSVGAAGAGGGSFAGAGAAGAHSLTTDTKAFIGNKDDSTKTAEDAAELSAAGNVSVTAEDTTELATVAGGAAAATGGVGVGLTAAVEKVTKDVRAFVGNHTKIEDAAALTVTAENTSNSTTAAAALGAAKDVGVAGSASETFVHYETHAYVGKNANVAAFGAANIQAHSNFTQGAGAGAVGGAGEVGVGISNTTVSLSAVTKAYADDDAALNAGGITIHADHENDITFGTVAGGAAGTAGANGAIGVNRLNTSTKAYAGKRTQLTSKGDLAITAADTTDLGGTTGGLSAAGTGGGGVSATVNVITKDTQAYADQGAALTGAGAITIKAENIENNLNTKSLQIGAVGTAGLAGAMTFSVIDTTTKAYTDTGVTITQTKKDGAAANGGVTVEAKHEIGNMTTVTAGVGGGSVAGVSAAVDLAYFNSQTNAYIGDSNTVNAAGDVTVKADEDLGADKRVEEGLEKTTYGIESSVIALSVGQASLSGGITIYNFNSALSDEDAKNIENSASGTTFNQYLNDTIHSSTTSDVFSKYSASEMNVFKTALAEEKNTNVNTAVAAPTTADKGTLAKIGNGTTINAGGNVTVDSDGKIRMNSVAGQVNFSGGGYSGSMGANVAVVNMDTQTKALVDNAAKINAKGALSVDAYAKHYLESGVLGASFAIGIGAAIQGTVSTWTDKSDVYALIGDTKGVSAKSISVAASSDAILDSGVVGASASMVAVNGAASTGKTSGTVKAGIGSEEGTNSDDSTVTATDGDITITAEARTDMDVDVTAPSAGLATLMGAGYGMTSDVDAVAFVGAGEKLTANKVNAEKAGISVTAKATPSLDGQVVAAGAGAAAMGAVAGTIDSLDTATVKIGSNAKLTAADDIAIKAETARLNRENKNYTIYGHVVGAAVTALAEVSVAVIQGTIDNDTTVTVANGAEITASNGRVDIDAKHSDKGNLLNDTVGVGAFGGDGADMRYNVTSDVTLNVGNGVKISSYKETDIDAENISEKVWADGSTSRKNMTSSGFGAAAGKGLVNRTNFTHNTAVTVGNNAEIRAAAAVADGASVSDAYAITIDAASSITSDDDLHLAAASGVAATHASNKTKATVTTTVDVKDNAKLYAGDVDAANGSLELSGSQLTGVAGTHGTTFRGGSIGIGTKNSADLHGKAIVDVYGGTAYADADNEVTYTGTAKTNFAAEAETAKGDIRVASGRDSEGNTGEITAEALTDIYNLTLIPYSMRSTPKATIDSDAVLDIKSGASIRSDRDIYLQSNSGDIYARGLGVTRSWTDDFLTGVGAMSTTYGESEISGSTATVTMNGTAVTGIHRNKTIVIGGENKVTTDENGNTKAEWVPTITSSAGISYTFSEEKSLGDNLYQQLVKLEQLLADYGADPAAKASYEAEIAFIKAKMIEQGYAYYAVGKNKKGETVSVFTRITSGEQTEYAKANANLLTQEKTLTDVKAAVTERQTALTGISTAHSNWQTASEALTDAATKKNNAQDELTKAETPYTAAKIALEAKLTDGQTITDYIAAHPDDADVSAYNTAAKAYSDASDAYTSAVTAYDSAVTAEGTAKTAYGTAVTNYAKTYYGTTEGLSKDPSAYNADTLKAESKTVADYVTKLETNYAEEKNEVLATNAFKEAGGTEGADGKFYLNNEAYTKYTYEGTEYDLLHWTSNGATTREVTVGDITAQLGDIYIEGNTVSGAGTMTAAGDASVTIENNSPYDVTVGGIRVAGKSSVNGLGQTTSMDGGSIIYTNTTTKESEGTSYRSTSSRTYSDAASLKAKLKDLTGNISARNDSTQAAVTITNNFKPNAAGNKDDQGSPYYAAPTLTLAGSIYAPKGSVTAMSEAGDIASQGSIRAASISLSAKNGDFIQSYGGDRKGADQIFNAGGDPASATYDEKTGAMTSKDQSTGILANGNIFISARYVNINSTIQSGIADYTLTIPADDKLTFSYVDTDGTTKTVNKATADDLGGTFSVTGATGNAAENLTYDAGTGSFVLSDISVSGGKIQIVGTIMNTAPEGESKGKILALDGYGNITIENKSSAGLELRNVNTGDGIEGRIEITDLDQKTGAITRKTTYTRENGVIKTDVDTYTYDKNGNATITKADTASSEKDAAQVIYKPASDLYYIWQTGSDSRTTTVYHYDDWDFDWWGIDEDEIPTGQDILDAGGTIISYTKDPSYTLPEGTTVGNKDDLWKSWWDAIFGGSLTDKYYTTGEKTFETGKTSTIDWKETRNWYSLWLTKSYDITLTEKVSTTTITQHAVKASQNIGIGFIGTEETRGNLTVDSNTGNVYVNGTVNNAGGKTRLTSATGSIIAGEDNFIDTKDLTIIAKGNAGGASSAALFTNDPGDAASDPLRTNAERLETTTEGNLYVEVEGHGVTLGNVTAVGTASITAAGDITQEENAVLKAKRAELYADGGSITGHTKVTPGTGYDTVSNALKIELTGEQKEAEDTGLKARATGDISIYNSTGDLYLDSAISETGDVTIISEGSIYDNNFTDFDNETVQEKLARWASDAILAGEETTIQKQKDRLKAAVDGKFSRYNYLKQYVDKDGNYKISDAEKDYLKANGYDDAKIASYVAEREAEYKSLVAAGVDTWKTDEVTAYLQGITDSTDTTLYGNAALTKDQLSGDKYLTQDEKATILVGTARSMQDLLVSFTSGEIKEGVTDTKTTKKETPHAEGKNVTLISMMGAIGKKTEDMTIDISTREKIENLTRRELAALAAAERSDFKINNNVVTLKTVKSITANTTGTAPDGKLIMAALGGSLYMTSDGSLKAGSDLYAADEMRVKTDGDIKDVTLGSGGETILESAEGEIDVTLRGEGTVTARAAKDIDLDKNDGDLIINTVYAAGGDVDINVTEGGIYADTRETSDFTNIEGEQITLTAKTAIGGARTTEEGTTVATPSIGLKATGAEAAEGKEAKAANIEVNAGTSADILNTGTADELKATAATGGLSLRNAGTIKSGEVKAEKGALTVTNEANALISGGTYTGKTLGVSNAGQITGGTFTATDALEVSNTGEIYDADLSGKTVTITNEADAGLAVGTVTAEEKLTLNNAGDVIEGSYSAKDIEITSSGEDASISDASFAADNALTVTNEGSVTGGTYTAGGAASLTNKGVWAKDTPEEGEEETEAPAISGKSVTIHNEGTITDGDFTATAGNLTFTDTAEAVTKGDITFTAKNAATGAEADSGNISITALGEFDIAGINAERKVTLTSANSISLDEFKAESAELTTTGENTDITLGTATVTDAFKVDAKGDAEIGTTEAGTADIDAGGDVTGTSLTTKKGGADIDAGGIVDIGTISAAGQAVDIDSVGKTEIGSLTAKSADLKTTGEGADITVKNADVEDLYKIDAKGDAEIGTTEAGTADIDAGGDVTGTSLTTKKGGADIDAGGIVDIGTISAAGQAVDIDSVGKTEIDSLTAKSADLKTTGEGAGITVTNATVEDLYKVNAKGDAEIGTTEAGTADIDAGGDVTGTSLTTTKGGADIDAGGIVNIGTISAAGQAVDIDSAGDTTVGTLTAKSADIGAGNDATITKATIDDALTVDAAHDATVTEAEAGSANITGGNDASVSKLETTKGGVTITATKGNAATGEIKSAADASISAGGNVTNEKLEAAGDVTINATEGSVTSKELTSGGDTSITAGTNISITKADVEKTITATAGTDLSIDVLEAQKANLNAGNDLLIGKADIEETFTGNAGRDADIDDLTAKDAEITSGRDTILTTTDIENTLKVISGKDIKVESKDTVAPTIKAGTIDMKADGDILVTTKTPTQKLEGVDPDAKAGAALDTTDSLPNASGKGSDYDVFKKGAATLESTKGEISAEAGGTVAADTVKTKDGEISLRGSEIGIDDLQNTGDTGVEVKIDGSKNGNDPAYYAGIHSSSKTPVEITDSRIEHLDFTGNDKIGIKDSRISGTGSMATDKVTIELGKELDGTAGWPIGRIFIDGRNIESTEPFGRNSGGSTINGDRFPETAERTANRALYSDNYAGRDGEEAEEDSEKKAEDTITFSEVRTYEQYRALSM